MANRIFHPAYKGVWEAKPIANPEHVDDDAVVVGVIGFDLWQVKVGTIFDSIIINGDVAEADAPAKKWKEALSGVEPGLRMMISALSVSTVGRRRLSRSLTYHRRRWGRGRRLRREMQGGTQRSRAEQEIGGGGIQEVRGEMD